jgi:GNAT superfamily N-acetyltransferase
MEAGDVEGAAALQQACFPPPFPPELLWTPEHLSTHLRLFPEGQHVAATEGRVIASASTLRISSASWKSHGSWDEITGGLFLSNHDPQGSLLYCADISVHPDWRRHGVGRALYQARFALVRKLGLEACTASCRLPGFRESGMLDVEAYAKAVVSGSMKDRTLTPLLRLGMTLVGVARDTMDDPESGNCAGLLEWRP